MIQKALKLLFVVFAFSLQSLYAQTVSGKVTDANDGTAIPGVSVLLKGSSKGTTTDFDGNYSIDVSGENSVLQFSYLGYKTVEITVNGQSTINVKLEEDTEALDEVVVTSLGLTREKKSLGYSVAKVDGSSLSLAKEANVVSSLAGKVSGVVVSKSTSGPGGGTRVVIRGNNSLNGNNQPLYVVDGVPVDNSGVGQPGTGEYSITDLGTGISDINSDDIESMTILKGPNAAALYGSRAANGVVIITTKKGKLGQGLGINYTTSITFDNPLVLPKYQNQYGRGTRGDFPSYQPSDDLGTQITAVRSSSSWGPRFDGSSQLAFNGQQRPYNAQPDNVKDFFETGVSFINTIALSNSNENSSVRFSYTNSDISSILPNSTVDRNNFNLRGFTKLSDKLSVDAKVTYFLQKAKNRPEQGTQGLAAYLWGMPRNVSLSDLRVYQDLNNPFNALLDSDFEFNSYNVISSGNGTGNPYWILYNDSNQDRRSRVSGFVKLDYQFNDWLSAFVRAGTDVLALKTESVTSVGHHFFKEGRLSYGQNDNSETNYDFLLMANKDLSDNFNLSANFGGNMRRSTVERSSIRGEAFKIPGKPFIANTDQDRLTASQSNLIEKRVNSLYGSASLSYQNKIFLDITGRNDWSSALAADNRSYFYSSASLSVLLDKMFDLGEDINFLKLKASTANVGNDTDAYQIVNLFRIAGDGYLGNVQVSRPSIKFSESLKPEDIRTTEFGLEFKAFNNRIFADFSMYNITTKDLIFDVPVDPGTGYSYFRENIGEITNKGFEVLVGGSPVKTENFTWNTSLNLAKNKNELVSLIDGQDKFIFSSSNGGIVDVRAQVGDGYGDIYTTTWLRNDAGQLVLTAEGRPQATSEREKFGNYQPDLTGGFTNTFSYKNLTLNALIDFRFGGEVFSFTDAALDASGVSERSLQYRDGGVLVEGVVNTGTEDAPVYEPNTKTITAQEYWGSVSGIGSEYVYDQTNIRLRELSLTYRLPSKVLENTFIQNLSLSLVGRNLMFLHKKVDNFDPESSYSTSNFSQGVLFYALPTTKSFGFSLNVNF